MTDESHQAGSHFESDASPGPSEAAANVSLVLVSLRTIRIIPSYFE
jgi:hypothetical protein